MTQSKIAYSYNKEGIYSGQCKAWKSPLEDNVYHLPASATFKEPLEKKEGNWIIWNGKDWEYKEIPKPEPKPEPEPEPLTYKQKREQEYSKKISNNDFQEAYFEKEFEGKPEKLNALQEKRLEIKKEIPKN